MSAQDYAEAGILPMIDSDAFTKAVEVIDPKYYAQRLAALPKVVVRGERDKNSCIRSNE